MKQKDDRFININYSVILGLYWMIYAASNIFMVPLLRSKGFDNIEIGMLISIRSVAAVIFTPLLASIADKFSHIQIKTILFILLVINIVNTAVMDYVMLDYFQMILIFIILGMTTNTMPPLHSTMAVRYNHYGKNIRYSIGRGIGSLSYAIASVVLGILVETHSISIVLSLQIALSIISLFAVYRFADLDKGAVGNKALDIGSVENDREVHSTSYIMKNYPSFSLFLVSSVFIFVGHMMCNSFMIDIITLKNGTNFDLGIASFILGLSELPTALLFINLKQKFGVCKLLNIAAFFTLIRMISLFFAPNLYFIYISQMFQMLGIGLYWPASVDFVERSIPLKDQAKGQSLVANFSMNIGGIMGASISGCLLSFTDIKIVMLYGIICTVIGVVIMSRAMRLVEAKKFILQ